MSIELAQWILLAAALYAVVGGFFALAFVVSGLKAVDPGAQKPSIALRLLLIPGSAALWPLLLRRWVGRLQPPTERNAHRRAVGESRSKETWS